ncbi:alkaline phosphatase D family protein [Pseudarthrobacter sp. HLT3-5]|uniref:alkaline phosphatase D family protein n=1 Tax=Pseudarthrobacter cellobiosi TaxID=2953654 RepID=UPI00208E846C|nr:alkaline phosphatase D family protein [Pseudarthrobacter sp. HLT3-5]MCO4275633.1 alkaline phosphatase D family protein [Pseudarthrobacter sp. HLT3-5]
MTNFTRRQVLRSAGVAAVAGAMVSSTAASGFSASQGGVFCHGVASGDPMADSVLLWTRVTPAPAALPGTGLGPDVSVGWEIAADAGFKKIVARGTAATGAARDHTVKVVAGRLAPATNYWYRFKLGQAVSPAGRTRTAPAAGAAVDRLKFGVVSCANWQAGYFSSYRHLAARGDLDAVLHLGDYLYEYGPGEYQARNVVVRPHEPAHEMTQLAHYRRRHAQYKTDPDLQALHAAAPFVVTWDDHESANDTWKGGAENHTEGTEGAWSERIAAAHQAYAEWMPVRYEPGGQLYRRLDFGSLASLSMLDLRSYRDQQAANGADPSVSSPARTITGAAQMEWLLGNLKSTGPQWKLVGNPVMIAPVRVPSTLNTAELAGVQKLMGGTSISGVPYNVDQWDGYEADRNRVVRHLRDNAVKDTVFLTGDIHSGWACDIPADPASYPATGDSVATELVCTSVTSDNLDDILNVPPRTGSVGVENAIKAANPHVKYLDFDSHGYSVLDVTAAGVRMDWYVLAERTSASSGATLSTSFNVQANSGKVTPTQGGLQ